jgi:SAM-dependent methyltransferase
MTSVFYRGDYKSKYSYEGLPIYSARGIHEQVFSLIQKNFSKNSNILILGSGSGSFEKRLLNFGYKNITSSDINIQNYKLSSKFVDFISIDLNTQFEKRINTQFDIIIGLEIIEHLHSPFNFLKSNKKLLKKGGTLVFSTPNLHSLTSRINFTLFGYPSYFIANPSQYDHISPIFSNIIDLYTKQLNYSHKKNIYAGSELKSFKFFSYKSYLYYATLLSISPIFYVLSLFNRKFLFGASTIYMLKSN